MVTGKNDQFPVDEHSSIVRRGIFLLEAPLIFRIGDGLAKFRNVQAEGAFISSRDGEIGMFNYWPSMLVFLMPFIFT